MNIAFFDFDGTITTNDSFIKFIRYCKGSIGFYRGIFLNSPVLLAFKVGLIPNWKAKEKLFSFFFKGMPENEIIKKGITFSDKILPRIIQPKALEELDKLKKSNTKIVVVTASFAIWVKPWCDQNNFELIATEHEVNSGKLTGKIKGKNCYGIEKVNRIKNQYNLQDYSLIYAYGNDNADLAMLDLADIKQLNWAPLT